MPQVRTLIATVLRRLRRSQPLDRTTVLAETVDPDGRRVQLTDERWWHILRPDGHPELAGFQTEVLRAVQSPDERRTAPRSNEQWFFLREAGPSRWLQVVVVYEGDRGFIVTAFGRRKDP